MRGAPRRSVSAGELAALTGGRLVGPGDSAVERVAPLERAGPGDLAFLAAKRYLGDFARSQASVVLVGPAWAEAPGPPSRVVVRDPHVALVAVLPLLYPPAVWEPGVHPTAVIGRGVSWTPPVAIGPYVVLGDGVRLGTNVRLGAGVVLGEGVSVGDDVECYPHVVCYPGTTIGNRVILHAGVRLGSDGFGYLPARSDGPPAKIPQVGRCVVGDDVEIGANTTVDRGSVDDTIIGPGTKIDNLVQVAHNVHIGARCVISGQAGIAGSTHLDDDVFLGGQAGLAPHLTVGRGARITVQGGVIGDIPAGATVSGYPARPHREFLRTQAALHRLSALLDDLEELVRRSHERAH